jgi:hypothetical protein
MLPDVKKAFEQAINKKIKSRFARAVAAVSDWCRRNRHWSLRDGKPFPRLISVRGSAATEQTRQPGNRFDVVPVTNPARLREGEHWSWPISPRRRGRLRSSGRFNCRPRYFRRCGRLILRFGRRPATRSFHPAGTSTRP